MTGDIHLVRMMILVELVIFTSFIVGFSFLQRLNGKKQLGEFPIHAVSFIVGKLSMGISWGFLFVQAARGQLNLFPIPVALEYVSAVLLLLGITFVISAFLHLGSDSRFGVSDDSGGLRTTGVYRVSRNPMYLSWIVLYISIFLLNRSLWLLLLLVVSIFLTHYLAVLPEERVLKQSFGDAFELYCKRVRRYI